MTTRQEKAKILHEQGFNCGQSVIAALSDLYQLDEKTALAVAGGFGGGMRSREICGAVSGAVAALGLIYPYDDAADEKSRDRIAKLTVELTKRFKAKHGNLACGALLASAKERRCAIYINDAVTIVEQMMEEINKGEIEI